jgi:hypothetical protein
LDGPVCFIPNITGSFIVRDPRQEGVGTGRRKSAWR